MSCRDARSDADSKRCRAASPGSQPEAPDRTGLKYNSSSEDSRWTVAPDVASICTLKVLASWLSSNQGPPIGVSHVPLKPLLLAKGCALKPRAPASGVLWRRGPRGTAPPSPAKKSAAGHPAGRRWSALVTYHAGRLSQRPPVPPPSTHIDLLRLDDSHRLPSSSRSRSVPLGSCCLSSLLFSPPTHSKPRPPTRIAAQHV